jgi:hypothetical protein
LTDHEFADQVRSLLSAVDNDEALALLLELKDADDEDADDDVDDVVRDLQDAERHTDD